MGSMKTLTLLRHAKTARGDADTADRDRRLTEQGREDAPAMGRWIGLNTPPPDLVLCSTAMRALETWTLAAPFIAAKRVEMRDALYLVEADKLLDILRAVPDAEATVLIVGHNAGIEDLAHDLAGDGNPDDIGAMAAKYATAGAAVLRFDTERWAAIDIGEGQLVHFMTPRRLGLRGG